MSETKLTHTERIIMEVLWQHGELSNGEVFNMIGEQHGWSRHMIKFYTKSMADKGMLGVNQISERKIKYYPLISKEQYLAAVADGFLKKNYKGLTNMVAGLINNEKVNLDEIEDLERLIKSYKEKA